MEDLILQFQNIIIDENKIIKIQKLVRKFLIYKNILIPSSFYQTKQWRKKKIFI